MQVTTGILNLPAEIFEPPFRVSTWDSSGLTQAPRREIMAEPGFRNLTREIFHADSFAGAP
jgi:hypothetical protein